MAAPAAISASPRPQIASALARAAVRTGVDFGYLLNQARLESGFDPEAQATTSSATGLFQFTEQTWLHTVKTHGAAHGLGWASEAIFLRPDGGMSVSDPELRSTILDLRRDPEIASAMAGELTRSNKAYLDAELGRAPEAVDLYLAHFLGAQGSVRFLRAYTADPSQPAAAIFPKAAEANRTIFYGANGTAKSLEDIRSQFARRLDQPGLPALASDFARPVQENLIRRQAVMRDIEAMPGRLSLPFAEAAYQRLATLDGAA